MAFEDIEVGNPTNLAQKIQELIDMPQAEHPQDLKELTAFLNSPPNSADIDFGTVFDSARIVQPSHAKELIVNLPHADRNAAAKNAAAAGQSPFNLPWYPMPEYYWDANSLFWKNNQPDAIPNPKKEEARQLRVGEYCMAQCK